MAEIEKLMGVSAADIEKVMGIGSGDIEKVMGVELVTSIGYQGNRSVSGQGHTAGYGTTTDYDYKALTSDSDTLDFGNAANNWGKRYHASVGSDSRICWGGGRYRASDGSGGFTGSELATNVIEYITIGSTGDGTDFGDMLVAGKTYHAGSGNGTRGLFCGGLVSGTRYDQIEYLTVASTGDTLDGGDLTRTIFAITTNANVAPGRMVGLMGGDADYTNKDFNYVAIMSTDDAADFGDAQTNGAMCPVIGISESRNVWAWGHTNFTNLLTMEYLNPSTTGDTTDFGDLDTTAGNGSGKHTNGTRGEVWSGEYSSNTDVQYITIASTGNATTAGEIRSSGQRFYCDAWSGD